jgi:hypothetical protein
VAGREGAEAFALCELELGALGAEPLRTVAVPPDWEVECEGEAEPPPLPLTLPLPLDLLSELFVPPPEAREPDPFDARAPAWVFVTRAIATGSSPLLERATRLISSSNSESSTATSS